MIIQKWGYSLTIIFLSLLISSCANVRWKHPTPSTEIAKLMMTEIQGAKDIDGQVFPIEETLTRLQKQNETKGTRPFQVVLIGKNNELMLEGYSEYLNSIGLLTERDFARFSIPNKENIQGYYYSYRGTMTTIRYSTPHMVINSGSKDSLVLYTKPITKYQITMIYQDGSKYLFNYNSASISRGILGFSKSYSNSFNGRFYVSTDYKTGQYELSSPMD
ncbi:hypothetical protein [Providencia burhodogranariea]